MKVPPRSSVALATTIVPVLAKPPVAMSSVAPLLTAMVPALSNRPGPLSVSMAFAVALVMVPWLMTSSVTPPPRPLPTMIWPCVPVSRTQSAAERLSVAPEVAPQLWVTLMAAAPPWLGPAVAPSVTTALASVCEPRKSSVAYEPLMASVPAPAPPAPAMFSPFSTKRLALAWAMASVPCTATPLSMPPSAPSVPPFSASVPPLQRAVSEG